MASASPPPDSDTKSKDQPSQPPVLAIVRSNASNHPRNLPVKRYDGEPLGRVDVQHALLSYLFSDTRRVFTNPRPSDALQQASTSASIAASSSAVPVPVYPFGTSAGCIRRSGETQEEYDDWKQQRERYLRWKKRIERKEKLERKAAAAATAAAAGPTEDAANANEEKDELAEGGNDDGAATAPVEEDEADEEDIGDETEPLDENEYPKAGAAKLTFKELYIESLLNSGKCTKSMRDKILADEEYAEDFAKVCLLVNVGRINTTLAFYPEMKTVLRSYHPIPSLQNNENTRRNMQDAPRMKSLLKGVLIDTERPAPPTAGPSAGQPIKAQKPNALSEEAPSDFREVIKRYRAGTVPPTSIVTLIFLLSLHAGEVTDMHFPIPHDSHSLFYPHADHPLPSKQRANSFMWILYHYLEGPATRPPGEMPNPFDDETSRHAATVAAEAYANTLTDDERKRRINQPWKGIVNPEWQKWKQAQENGTGDAETSAARTVTKRDSSEDVKKETNNDGDVSMDDSAEKGEKQAVKEPPAYLYRLLLPTLETITPEEAAQENHDTEEEIRWGKQMQAERATFLAKFQDEDAAKNPASSNSPAPSTGAGGGKGRRTGGAASTSNAASADRRSPSEADASRHKRRQAGAAAGDVSKRSRMASPIDFDDSSSDADSDHPLALDQTSTANPLTSDPYLNRNIAISDRIRRPLWDLDLSVPRQHQITESLPQIAWARILERAQRGVGDACYESDEDDFAMEEAQEPERSRSEICRILTGLQGVVRHEVFDEDNHKIRVKYGGYEQREGQSYGENGRDEHETYRRGSGHHESDRRVLEPGNSSTPLPAGRGVTAYDQSEEATRNEVDLDEVLLGGDEARRQSVGAENGYTSVRA